LSQNESTPKHFFREKKHWIYVENNELYALNCTTPVFYTLVPTCFACSLPSSGNYLDMSELLEIQIE
jgi:hypothetical protein